MATDPYRKAGNIYLRLMQVSEADRPSFLDENCEDDQVRGLVEEMLKNDAASAQSAGMVDSKSAGSEFEETVIHGPERVEEAIDAGREVPDSLGRYEIRGMLGEGGFGAVYLGFDSQLQREVAIKVPRKVLKGVQYENFLQEARRVAQLRHPGIVSVFDVGEADDCVYIVSDYISGTTLTEWLRQEKPDWKKSCEIVANLADALAHAHSAGMVHRDVKPGNVIMTAELRPVLLDFGLAISSSEGGEMPGMVTGTPHYMSPEQTQGKAHRVDGRTDIYALGVVLYRMLTGRLPIEAPSTSELLRRISEDDPQPVRQIVPGIPPNLEEACHKAMSRRMSDRYSTAGDFAQALREIIGILQPSVDSGEKTIGGSEATMNRAADSASKETTRPSLRSERLHEAERRQVTALYCEVDESNLDFDELDPEDLHDIVRELQKVCFRVAEKFGGHVGQKSSEGMTIYFGYPVSYEDSVQRAIRSGLEMATSVAELNRKLEKDHGAAPDFRVGIHTGLVVAEEDEEGSSSQSSSMKYSIVGNAPKVATTLAGVGEPNTVAISGTVESLIRNSFECRSMGEFALKGSRKVEVFEVVGELAADAANSQPDSTPLIGREHELGILQQHWDQADNGAGQVVLVCAEAGVGKSRLFSAFRKQLQEKPGWSLEARSSAYHENTAMHAIIGMLERLLEIQQDDRGAVRLSKLEEFLDSVELSRDEFVPVLADLLSVTTGGRYRAVEGTPDRKKQRTIETLVEFFLTLSDEKPILFVLEDLHWVDPTTLELLTALIGEAASAPILMILTFRPNFIPPWPMKPGLSQLMLSHLNAEQTTKLAEHISGKPLPEAVVNHIATRTDGVPLFVEEMTKAVLESSVLKDAGEWYELTGPLDSLSIPNTLQDSLMARLDRLGGAREIAQLASIIGREFTYKLLAEVAPIEGEILQAELKQLVDAELLHQRGRFPRARFTFKHALVQDTAYESLLKRARQDWHGKIADVLLEKFPDTGETEPELIARHFTEAGRSKEAVDWWLKAGVKAQEGSAYAEAISHIQAGLALIEDVDDETERAIAEFKFQIPLGVSYLSTQGYASPSVGPVFERARELGDQFASPGEQFHILWGIWAWRVVREELDLCMKLFEDAFRMKAVLADDGLRMEAHFIPGLTQFYTGEFESSRHHCETGFQLYNEERCKAHGVHTGQNSGVTIQCYWGLSLWMLGHQEEALARIEGAVQLARDLGDLFSLAYALHHLGWLSQHARLTEQVVTCSDETLQIGTEQGFLFWIAEGTLCRGYGLYLSGDLDTAEATIQGGVGGLEGSGAALSLCHFYTMLAEVALAKGELNDAAERIETAIEASGRFGNRFMIAESHRIKGEILKANSDETAAEAAFNESLEIARSQSARSWELRTATSLARLLQSQGKNDEAKTLLAPALEQMPSGRELADQVDAAALLAELK